MKTIRLGQIGAWGLSLLLATSATARIVYPTVGNSLRDADTIIVGTVLSDPVRVGVSRLCRVNEDGPRWQDFSLSVTKLLDRLVQLLKKNDTAGHEQEVDILWDSVSRYYWVWQCHVAVSNVLRGSASTNTVTIRQFFTYTGVVENTTLTPMLEGGRTYVLFLRDPSPSLGAGQYELDFCSLAVPTSEVYTLKGGTSTPERITYDDFLRLIKQNPKDESLNWRWLEPEPQSTTM